LPTKFLLYAFVAAFVWYLIFGVPKGLRQGRGHRKRYWVFLIAFILLLFFLIRMI
jgi:hypothetical protein